MRTRVKLYSLLFCLSLFAGLLPAATWAQGVTTAAVSGRVTSQQGQGVANARVGVTNTATGASSGVTTRSDGRYFIPGLQPGQYRVSVSAIGFAPVADRQVTLTLGQTAELEISLSPQAVALEGLTITAEDNPVLSRGRTGPATVVSDSTLRRTPTITRDLQDFTRLVPQLAVTNSTTGAVSAGGRNARYNQIQIDGAANSDLYGLSFSGSPGGQAGAKTITMEAIQELQVVLAPFDVRQSGFTGASVNAVTRSGTNRFQGSLSGFTRDESMAGRFITYGDTASAKLVEFQNREFAGSFGGPIVRDKAFFFLAGEFTNRTDPTNYVAGTNTIEGVTLEQAQQVRDQLIARGYDPGTSADREINRDSRNLFGRVDLNLGQNHRLTLRHNYVDGSREQFPRSATSFYLTNAGYTQNSTTNSTVFQLNSGFGGGIFNELRLGYLRVRDHRDIPGDIFPRVEVRFGTSSRAVLAGSENSSVANVLDQNSFEITNDLTIPWRAHTFTVGTNNEISSFSNLFAQNIYGNYRFDTYADFVAGKPSQYQYRYLVPDADPSTPGDQPGKARSELATNRYSLYAQDRWDVRDNLQLTAGIRFEMPTFPDNPVENPAFFNIYGRHTSEIPNNLSVWNPRVGFNWDALNDGSTQLRGGVGLFSGRAPAVWVTNAFGATGLEYVVFTCTNVGTTQVAPLFVADPNQQPRNCLGTTNPAANTISLVDSDLKLPQVARASLGIDRELPLGLVASLEGLYTRTVNEMHFRNLRVEPIPGAAAIEGRPAYRVRANTPGFGDVIEVTNTTRGSTYSLTGQIQRPFRNNWDFSLAYTLSRAEDIAPLNNSTAGSSWSFNLHRFDPNHPELTRSDNDVPHRIVGTTSYRLNLLRRLATDLSLVYVGQSGKPYSYRYGSDVNGDGSTGNDLVYVPASETGIRFQPGTTAANNAHLTPAVSWTNLNNFIESVDCLREARGTVIERNSCREPWSNRFDFRLAQSVSAVGQNAQITLDILNVGNLINREWGRSEFQNNQAENLLTLGSGNTAADASGHRLYAPFAPRTDRYTISNLDSRYQLQLGLRYSF
jgi:hypothetical protein